ncbi:MAG: 23S rRNA (adenine(2503)-C(2))-methyltransferase RlmN [Clostridia bacterium]|nr:23S rRNA (adenine(2503)-C(2))-methyltransferase RlmN [Clostridia bacterium]MBQ2720465.1 23S rRNA (adenine(2503)-C(2))-methyltransferase RlmN [Clostridia bacterium]
MKTDIASLNFDRLSAFVAENGLPKYRTEQLFRWISRGVLSFDEMTDISKDLRAKLSQIATLPVLKIEKKLVSSDGTVKFLFTLEDGEHVETVVMKYEHGNSVCISSQVGCRMNCAFCASSLKGLQRSLTAGEMLAQVAVANRECNVSSLVVMGIGEPMDNYENILTFLENLSDPRGLAMSLRHVSVSTCGIVPKINDLAEKKLQLTLSVSLHAPDDETRNKIMPVNRKWNVKTLIDACNNYIEKTGRRISFEYTLIKGVNDSVRHAETLAKLLRGMLAHVNLIPVNYVMERGFEPSSPESIRRFYDTLKAKGINVTVRRTLGSDINAACGQLRHKTEAGENN